MTYFVSLLILLEGWKRKALAFGAGALASLAQAPLGWFPILWLAIPIFIWLLDSAALGKSARQAAKAMAAVGWFFGFGFFLATFYWLGAAFLVEADKFAWAMPLAILVLPAGLALFWACAGAVLAPFWSDQAGRLVWFALMLTAFEWLRGTVLTGLPWGGFGAALASNEITMQALSITGPDGMTLFALLLFGLPVCFASGQWHRTIVRLSALGMIALFAAQLTFGFVRTLPDHDERPDAPVVRLVQPNIPQKEKWKLENRSWIFNRLLALSSQDTVAAPASKVDMVIWPESAIPFFLIEQPAALSAIADSLPPNAGLMTGALRPERNLDRSVTVYNSIYTLDNSGTILSAYDKTHLVPFGEYLPFQNLLEAIGLEQLTRLKGGFAAGSSRNLLFSQKLGKALPLICYEVAFSREILGQRERADWILNVTNDAWFGKTIGPLQHLHLARMRAVEFGLPLIRVANTGITAVIDAKGRILASLDLNKDGILQEKIPPKIAKTFYARFGLLPILGIWLLLFAINWFFRRKTNLH